MTGPSFGVNFAWNIAVAETHLAGLQYIEKE